MLLQNHTGDVACGENTDCIAFAFPPRRCHINIDLHAVSPVRVLIDPKRKLHTLGEVTSHNLWSRYDRHFAGITRYNLCQLNKIKSLCLTKCLYDHELTNKAYLGDITAANIYKSFTHKMAAKTSWHRYGYEITSLSPYITLQITVTGCTHDCNFLHGENNKIYAKQERRLSQRNYDILCVRYTKISSN